MNNYDNKIIQDDMKLLLKSGIDFEKLNQKTIFITGSTGMLASYIVYFLIFLNENIENFSCNIILQVRNIEKCKQRFGKYIDKNYIEIYEGNIIDEIKIDIKIDFIIHAASIAMTQIFKEYPIDVALPNTMGTYRLLELAVKNNIESFLYFSTCSIYGKIEDRESISEDDYGILDPLDINSCYSESKRFGETLCRAYWNQKRVPTKMVRISHTYGPTIELDKDNRVFSDFVRNILNEENIVLKSNGKAKRSFCYITDATEAFLKILLNGKNGEAYNMSNPYENISILELAERLVKKFEDKKIKIVTKESIKENYTENKFSNEVYFSIEKTKGLGWVPKISIEDGFEKTVNSFKV